ncbi:MAG TPA: hypothetical protein VLS47_02840, partial [Gallionella sp.]|nr:hypothetical protein [Gallionella sp.]
NQKSCKINSLDQATGGTAEKPAPSLPVKLPAVRQGWQAAWPLVNGNGGLVTGCNDTSAGSPVQTSENR